MALRETARKADTSLALGSGQIMCSLQAREALLYMMDQVTYLAWAIGPAKYYRPCFSVFPCSSPYSTKSGAEPMMKHDLTRARQLVKESGYDGRPVVVIHTTDRPHMNAAAIVTR